MSNNAASDLLIAKRNLQGVLGESMSKYYQLLKMWFKQKMTREDFDHEARKLLTMDAVHLHNQFILALLCKCQSLGSSLARTSSSEAVKPAAPHVSSTPKPAKRPKMKKTSYSSPEKVAVNQFLAVNPLIMAPQIQEQAVTADEPGPDFSARQLFLPDAGMLHGRLLVAAWENALDDITDQAVLVLQQAVETALKNILSAVMSRRSGYRLREKRFKYGFGADIPASTQRTSLAAYTYDEESEATSVSARGNYTPSIKPTAETAHADAAMALAASCTPAHTKEKISLLDLYKTLQVHKSAVPCHSVYATNLARIVSRMWHPTAEELEHEQLHRREIKERHQLYAEQLASTVS